MSHLSTYITSEHGIKPSTMAVLAAILRRCPGHGQKAFAKKLMLSSSALGDKSATFEIISAALRTGSLTEYSGPLERLCVLARKESDPRAMTLLGKVSYSQRGEREALEWFQKATRPPTGSIDFDGAGDALVNEGRILLGWKRKEEAKAAFEKAALELDDPSAYFHLSQLQKPDSPEQKVYLMKAAASGVSDAWHELGLSELATIAKRAEKPTKLEDYGMAREWFEVAAADGFGLSMLNMSLMCKSVGKLEEGMIWLEKAAVIPEVREQAIALKSK